MVEAAILSLNVSKDYRPAGWFPGAGVPESGAQVCARDKRREGAAERKKETKKGKCKGVNAKVRRYEGKVYEGMVMAVGKNQGAKRDLNTLEAKARRISSSSLSLKVYRN